LSDVVERGAFGWRRCVVVVVFLVMMMMMMVMIFHAPFSLLGDR